MVDEKLQEDIDTDYVIKPYPEVRLHLSPEKYWDWIAYGLVKPSIVRLKIQQEAEGTENLKNAAKSGYPVFCFSNHVSWADHFLILNVIDDNVTARTSGLCKEKYYTYPFFGWLLKKGNMIPITNVKMCYARWFQKVHGRSPRQSEFVGFIDNEGSNPLHEVNINKRELLFHTADCVTEMLNRNHIILGYPEGTRNETGSLRNFRTGIIQLSFQFKGMIVPTAISGTDKVLPKGMKWHKIFQFYFRQGASTKVRFGKAIDWTELLRKCREIFRRVGDKVNLENVELLHEKILSGRFRAYSIESERFECIFKESSLIIMHAVNDIVSGEYKSAKVDLIANHPEHPAVIKTKVRCKRRSGTIGS